jgi:toxin CptA
VQGRFAWLTARDARGRVVRLAWWPDTLGPGNARVLRLAAAGAFSPPGRARAASFATMPG